jgi:hypothetical protein
MTPTPMIPVRVSLAPSVWRAVLAWATLTPWRPLSPLFRFSTVAAGIDWAAMLEQVSKADPRLPITIIVTQSPLDLPGPTSGDRPLPDTTE